MIDDPVLVNDWYPIGRAEDLIEGGVISARLLGEDIVLWRLNGKIMAWQDLCIHRGAQLSLGQIKEGGLMCPYHGWTYNETGRCIQIPAHPEQTPPTKAQAKTYQSSERYGMIWVSLGEPEREIPPFPEWDKPEFCKIFCGPYHFKAGGPRAIENFLDIAHLSFVHDGLLGDSNRAEIPDYKAVIGPDGIEAKHVGCYAPSMPGRAGGMVYYTYRVFRPLTAYLATENESPGFSMIFWVTPHDTLESTAWVYLVFNSTDGAQETEIREWQDRITYQDKPIVESQRPELLPLDLQAELHLRSDRLAIAYRKWLNELGLTFGTA